MKHTNCGNITKKLRLYAGYTIDPCGLVRTDLFQERDFNRMCDPRPVIWNGAPAERRYHWWRGRKPAFNPTAAKLIQHTNYPIWGPAILTVGRSDWHYFRVDGDEHFARTKIEHLDLQENVQVVLKPAGRHNDGTYILVQSDKLAAMVKLSL